MHTLYPSIRRSARLSMAYASPWAARLSQLWRLGGLYKLGLTLCRRQRIDKWLNYDIERWQVTAKASLVSAISHELAKLQELQGISIKSYRFEKSSNRRKAIHRCRESIHWIEAASLLCCAVLPHPLTHTSLQHFKECPTPMASYHKT